MFKKWKKITKLFATTIIVLVYATIGLFNNETLKSEEENKKPSTFGFEPAGKTEKYFRTIKTVIGYSEEFRMKKEMDDGINCEAGKFPDGEKSRQNSMWAYEEKLGIQIFSAYYDQRQEPYHYVRIIGLVRRNSSFYCQIWYRNNETMTYKTQKAFVREIWSNEWGFKNRTCETEYPGIISCLSPSQNITGMPSWVSFVDKSCTGGRTFVRIKKPILYSSKKKKNFVICVKPLNFDDFNKKNILEWLEINLGLGAEKFIFYGFNSTRQKSVFRNSVKAQILEWKKFREPQRRSCTSRSFEDSIWYKRKMEIIAYNDCFYSNLYQTKFVIPLDVDEIIVPKTGNNWLDAFRSFFLNGKLLEETKKTAWPEDIENYASFSVQNAYFFPEYPKDAIIRSLTLPKPERNVPIKLVKDFFEKGKSSSSSGSIFGRTLRSYRLSPKSDSVKSFIHVPKTLSVFNHYAFHVLGEATRQFIFPETAFQLNHYRNSCDPLLIDGCREFLNQVIYDNSLEKFRKKPFFEFVTSYEFNLQKLL